MPLRSTQFVHFVSKHVLRVDCGLSQLGSSSDIQFLTAEEEHLLVKLYVTKISQLCGHFRFPEEVEATAVSYLKRFYLKNTVMDWHPKNVMYVCGQSLRSPLLHVLH